MTAELMDALVDHSAGNYRLLMIMGAELLAYGMAHDVAQLDEKCYLEVFQSFIYWRVIPVRRIWIRRAATSASSSLRTK